MAATREFRAEVRKVLDILTNSLYTNREIFLRELISNASDALEKLRFRSNGGEAPRSPETASEIRVTLDREAGTVTIADTGVGMTADELAENLGTIARSGSEEFLASIGGRPEKDAAADSDEIVERADDAASPDAAGVIGRFGVGFYSVFMVADRVTVTSRPAYGDGDASVWTSDGRGTFTVEPAGDGAPERGSVIVAHLKADAAEFLEPYRVRAAILRHSAFVPFPVFLDGDRVNTQPALWREPKSSIRKEDYAAFYRHLTHEDQDPLDTLHIAVDAPVQFNALLFIPAESQDFWGADRDAWGLDLYARRVLIQRRCKELVPEWLAFLKGVADTEDLPLNISRESLQENRVLGRINQTIVRQALTHFERMAADRPDDYAAFWRKHGKVFKLSCQDFVNRERVMPLMRFNSSAMDDADGLTGFEDYKRRAPDGQKTIWYISAPSREAARLNPYFERFRRKGVEVLFLYEPVDEFVMADLGHCGDWDFRAAETAADDALDAFPDKETDDRPAAAPLSDDDSRTFDGMLARMKEILGDRVLEVRASRRLAGSPAVLAAPSGDMTSSMEKILRAMRRDEKVPVKALEVNRDHPLLRNMLRMFKADPQDATLAAMTEILLGGCLLRDGDLTEPQDLVRRTDEMLERASGWYAEVRKL